MLTAAPWCASLPAFGHVQVKDRIIWAKKAIGQDWLKPLEAQRATEEFKRVFEEQKRQGQAQAWSMEAKAASINKGINSANALRGEWCNSSHHETCSVPGSLA